ncbi:hypothetical protein GCM10017322_35530 [Paracoccus aerius]|nr:hypothetical protein GCM10017322_35530 [Paracoccus aerius]
MKISVILIIDLGLRVFSTVISPVSNLKLTDLFRFPDLTGTPIIYANETAIHAKRKILLCFMALPCITNINMEPAYMRVHSISQMVQWWREPATEEAG